MGLVYWFQEAENSHDIDAVLSMLAYGVEFEIVTLVGKKQIRAILKYDSGVNTGLRFFNFRLEENTVTCQVVERNDGLTTSWHQNFYQSMKVRIGPYRRCQVGWFRPVIAIF